MAAVRSSWQGVERSRLRSSARSRLGRGIRILAGALGGLVAVFHFQARAFVSPPSPLTTQQAGASVASLSPEPSAITEAESRRSAVSAVTVALVSAWTSGAALAEDAAQPKKEKPPNNLIIEGYKGDAEPPINGRWEATFGKKVNGKMVYKRDGHNVYLLNNDCGEFQITLDRKKSTCDSGLGVKKEGSGWIFGSTPQPGMKVRPETKDDKKGPEIDKSKEVDLERLVLRETEKFAEQNAVETFRGRMDPEDELVGDRLMKKMGAKIIEGM
eukprot:TRINITY_DN79723_c0_g1_i1.p1 TRINITY_DN79723_c0_g1~~TRINITY_DN79723_c0_g1_i1.p1  ORF type:complete len:283 (-),score=60.30 TRINITY_DN79723_c0_g1_i1:9-821(-)